MCGEDKRWMMPLEEVRLREAIMRDVDELLPSPQFGPVRAVLRSLIVQGHRCDEAGRQLDLIMRGKLKTQLDVDSDRDLAMVDDYAA